MKILVTGGLGYIGSHVVVELQQLGYEVLIVDDCSNAHLSVLDNIAFITGVKPQFEQLDLRNSTAARAIFSNHQDIAGVIHFAASKAVGESVIKPLLYYENNINALVYLLKELCGDRAIPLIFSSSCTVYGQATTLPITENAPIVPAASPYGNTKQIGEEIISDCCQAYNDFTAIALRYFNPIGAHDSARIGELPLGIPQNLVPYITQTAIGLREQLSVYGSDYDTIDGTAIRDYIHVVDLALAHITALKRLLDNKMNQPMEVFNIGTGTGSTVMQVIKSFEAATGVPLKYKLVDRRSGDITAAYADTSRAENILGWKSRYTLQEALAHAWKWEQHIRA